MSLRDDILAALENVTTDHIVTQAAAETMADELAAGLKDKLPRAWLAGGPCPDCGQNKIIGFLLVNEKDKHMHTRYVCTFWPANPPGVHARSITKMCGWEGWVVPGWDKEEN